MADTEIWDGADWRDASAGQVWDGTQWLPLTSGGAGPPAETWTRPADWLPTTVAAGEQKIQLLVAIWDGAANQLGFNAGANATVDWGDGTAPEQVAGTVGHTYNAASISSGTVTSEGFKQALVTITPTTGNLTSLNLTAVPFGTTYSAPVLEAVVGPSTITSLGVGHSAQASACVYIRHVSLLSPITVTTGLNLFQYCQSLRKVDGTISISGTDASNMFQYCYVLTDPPTIQTSTVTSTYQMFYNCRSLTAAPLFDTSKVTNFSYMLGACPKLVSVPAYNTSKGTNFANMFAGSTLLREAPALDVRSGGTAVSIASMFNGCFSLASVPVYDLTNASNAASVFTGCSSLVSVRLTGTNTGVPSFTSLFSNSSALRDADMAGLRSNSWSSTFNNCFSLTTVKNLDLSDAPNSSALSSLFTGCRSLRTITWVAGKGPRFSFSVGSTMLDAAQLNTMFTNLPTITGQTVTITSCPGAATCDRSIATGKGWTVTG
jgi:surface protein